MSQYEEDHKTASDFKMNALWTEMIRDNDLRAFFIDEAVDTLEKITSWLTTCTHISEDVENQLKYALSLGRNLQYHVYDSELEREVVSEPFNLDKYLEESSKVGEQYTSDIKEFFTYIAEHAGEWHRED